MGITLIPLTTDLGADSRLRDLVWIGQFAHEKYLKWRLALAVALIVYFLYRIPYTLYLTSKATTVRNDRGLLETTFLMSFAYGKELILLLFLIFAEVIAGMRGDDVELDLCAHRHSPLSRGERLDPIPVRNGELKTYSYSSSICVVFCWIPLEMHTSVDTIILDGQIGV